VQRDQLMPERGVLCRFFGARHPGWKNEKHRAQGILPLKVYAYPEEEYQPGRR